jgi:hypothetical protein
MRSREAGDKGQFLYCNTACWALTGQVPNEIGAAQSPLLRVIASPTTATTMTNSQDSPIGQMLSGFLHGENYQGIRDRLTQYIPDYRAGTEDTYQFPDDEGYQVVRTELKIPADVSVRVFGPDGKQTNLVAETPAN